MRRLIRNGIEEGFKRQKAFSDIQIYRQSLPMLLNSEIWRQDQSLGGDRSEAEANVYNKFMCSGRNKIANDQSII